MHESEKATISVGDRNIEAARTHLSRAGFSIRGEHVGRQGYRKVEFDLHSGAITVLHGNQRVKLV